MLEKILNDTFLFVFAKDIHSRYLFCNENFAEIAGLDSPAQIAGKTDRALYWKEQADFFINGDREVLSGKPRIHMPEIQKQPEKTATLLVTKSKLLDANNNCIGVVGSFIDITGFSITKNSGHYDPDNQRLYLGEIFDNEYLTLREVMVFRLILYGYTSQRIAMTLKISAKTVEGYTENIKNKLQCSTKAEILSTAIQHGLTYILFSTFDK